ncbi:FAD:protein FMN transferase [Luteimonas sp. SDU101]|uniref:FAD:protein FMN transferase n=1 Tax=Luteimonas sp. SDU101 TaxID=3422593 RepID=UPI003EBE5650
MTLASSHASPVVLHTLYGETMGTRWRVDLFAARSQPLEPLHGAVQARLDAIVAQMSSWEPGSDLARFNRAPAGSWHPLPDDFFAVMDCALQVARDSGGAFDPTLGALVGAWGFGALAQARGTRPDDAALASARAESGWQRLQLDRDGRRLLQPGDLVLDLSAIAKGYGVDAVVALLREHGIDAALVDVGGELRGLGRKPDGSAWRVLVESGGDEDEAACIVTLDDAAIATSGPCWQRFELDGRELSHTIDPRTGRPVADPPAAVSVIAGSAMLADAWSTALSVMGVDAGAGFAGARGLAARLLPPQPGAQALTTPAFEAYLPS